eukprot:1138957-Pelagomonas_calceolata.AAC.2
MRQGRTQDLGDEEDCHHVVFVYEPGVKGTFPQCTQPLGWRSAGPGGNPFYSIAWLAQEEARPSTFKSFTCIPDSIAPIYSTQSVYPQPESGSVAKSMKRKIQEVCTVDDR